MVDSSVSGNGNGNSLDADAADWCGNATDNQRQLQGLL
jgi:hypothetical protein